MSAAHLPNVEIVYCRSCNHLQRAVWIAQELLADLQFEVGSLLLTGGDKGVFDVRVGGAEVFSKGAMGRFPEPEELKVQVFDALRAASSFVTADSPDAQVVRTNLD